MANCAQNLCMNSSENEIFYGNSLFSLSLPWSKYACTCYPCTKYVCTKYACSCCTCTKYVCTKYACTCYPSVRTLQILSGLGVLGFSCSCLATIIVIVCTNYHRPQRLCEVISLIVIKPCKVQLCGSLWWHWHSAIAHEIFTHKKCKYKYKYLYLYTIYIAFIRHVHSKYSNCTVVWMDL